MFILCLEIGVRKIAPEENCPRSGSGFGLGLALELGLGGSIFFAANFPRTHEIVLILIKTNKRVKGINIFEHTSLYLDYADDTTFFSRDKRSIKELFNTFATFSKYSGLKPNHKKCEIAGSGVLKSVKVAVCDMKSIDLCNDTIKITGIHFSYNKEKENEKKKKKILQISKCGECAVLHLKVKL